MRVWFEWKKINLNFVEMMIIYKNKNESFKNSLLFGKLFTLNDFPKSKLLHSFFPCLLVEKRFIAQS